MGAGSLDPVLHGESGRGGGRAGAMGAVAMGAVAVGAVAVGVGVRRQGVRGAHEGVALAGVDGRCGCGGCGGGGRLRVQPEALLLAADLALLVLEVP